jgi:hypothetical protein
MARPSFPLTTPSQRRLLFQMWEATGNVEYACRVAVKRRTCAASPAIGRVCPQAAGSGPLVADVGMAHAYEEALAV